MAELDFANIYSSGGKIIQQRYAQKAASAGSTVLAMRNSKGAVLIVAKPIISKLYVQESDHRIKKIADHVHMAYTGILPDGFFITDLCKTDVQRYRSQFNEAMPASSFKQALGTYLYLFTQYNSARVPGVNFLTIMKDGAQYKVYGTDCSGKVTEYFGYAIGAGERRAQTEIEKLDLENMEMIELVDQGIKILYKCHDSLSDLPFSVEVGIISDDADGQFVRMSQAAIDQIVEEYKDLSMDGEDE